MSLKSEIDKTNDLKNKTKKAKDNINTKLIELGGQNANNLADVPNKIQDMVGQYKKIAILNLNKKLEIFNQYITIQSSIDISQIEFKPKEIIVISFLKTMYNWTEENIRYALHINLDNPDFKKKWTISQTYQRQIDIQVLKANEKSIDLKFSGGQNNVETIIEKIIGIQ